MLCELSTFCDHAKSLAVGKQCHPSNNVYSSFQLSDVKRKPKSSLWLIIKGTNNPVNQLKLEESTSSRRKTSENVRRKSQLVLV